MQEFKSSYKGEKYHYLTADQENKECDGSPQHFLSELNLKRYWGEMIQTCVEYSANEI